MELSEITIKLPKMLANDISGKDIIGMVMDKFELASSEWKNKSMELRKCRE